MTPDELDRLARVAAVLRQSWPLASLRTWFEGFATRNPHRTYAATMQALVACALDPRTEKPARLEQAGPWWQDPRQDQSPQIFSGPQAVPCRVPGHRFHSGEPCDGKPVRGMSETAAAALAQAREDLAVATQAARDADKAAEAKVTERSAQAAKRSEESEAA